MRSPNSPVTKGHLKRENLRGLTRTNHIGPKTSAWGTRDHCAADAATLKGVIRANEMRGEPMANVPVAAGGANPTTSDSFGKFTLEFPRKNPGDPVEVIPKREGYLPVNDVQLELALPADSDVKAITIILCREEVREEMARRFYQLKSFDAIEETYRKRVKELEDTQTTGAALTKLRQERDQSKAAAEKASEELAKNQSGRSSELYQEAKRLFVESKVEEAITLLDDEKIRQSVAQAKQKIADAVQDWLLKAQLLSTQFRFQEADKAYRQAIEAKPDSFDANFAYARFNQSLNHLDNARALYKRCLDIATEQSVDFAVTLNNLGIVDTDQNRVNEAEREFEKALETYEVAKKEPEARMSYIASTLNNMGVLYQKQHELKEAREYFEEALKIRRELADKNPDTYLLDLALTLNNLGDLSSAQKQVKEARQEFGEALQNYKILAKQDPERFSADVTRVKKLLAELPNTQGP